ncbi:hypothetical protein F5887DRAFT_1244626 [Amanita rubescens]|nr:hypothetical protein F5887DRAFT_1244626 [Amanita rubescens]
MDIGTSVPTEILCEIFLLLRDKPIALNELKNRLCFSKFPWAIGQVCRHWRLAFLSNPALWSSLSIEDPDHRSPSVAYIAEMERRTAIYLRRSEPHPLTVIVCFKYVDGFPKEVWDMLLSCSDRWKKLYLWLSNQFFTDGLVSRRGKMPILESLRLSMTRSKRQNDLTAFEIAPCLTELELAYSDSGEREWAFPLAQLTKLNIDLPPSLDFTDSHRLRMFLLQLQNVEELRFTISYIKEGFGTLQCLPVRFPRLRLLRTPLLYPGVFSWFEVPLLEDLLTFCSLFSTAYDPDECKAALLSLVHCSPCHIRHLTLENCKVEEAHNIMEALTSVEKLCIKYSIAPKRGPRLVRDIAEANGIYLPNLRMLQVPCCPGYFEEYVSSISYLLEVRNRKPQLTPASSEITSLERLIIAVNWTYSDCYCCSILDKNIPSVINNAIKVMFSWPSFSVAGLNANPSRWNPTLTVCASAAGALVDLTIHYPRDAEVSQNCFEESRRLFESVSSVFVDNSL